MRSRKPKIAIVVLFILLVLSLLLAGCSLTGTEGDPYSAGQRPGRNSTRPRTKRAISSPGSAAQLPCRPRRSGWWLCCDEEGRIDPGRCAKDIPWTNALPTVAETRLRHHRRGTRRRATRRAGDDVVSQPGQPLVPARLAAR